MRKRKVVIEFDLDCLANYTEVFLAQLWHVCQANPAPFGDREACDAAEAVKSEIVRRWLKDAPVELFSHQASHVATEESICRNAEDLARREFAEALVDGAADVTLEHERQGWCGCSDLMGRDGAIAKVAEHLRSPSGRVSVTRCVGKECFRVWTGPV